METAISLVVLVLLFPVGLVFLFVRETIRLDVALFDGHDGAVVLDRVRASLAGIIDVAMTPLT